MQTLTFNTKTKIAKLLDGPLNGSKLLDVFENISTVKCSELGFYEIMQKQSDESNSAIPILRLPISNTNMYIVNRND